VAHIRLQLAKWGSKASASQVEVDGSVILSRSAERLWPEQPCCVLDVSFGKQEAIQAQAKNLCISVQEKCLDPSLPHPSDGKSGRRRGPRFAQDDIRKRVQAAFK